MTIVLAALGIYIFGRPVLPCEAVLLNEPRVPFSCKDNDSGVVFDFTISAITARYGGKTVCSIEGDSFGHVIDGKLIPGTFSLVDVTYDGFKDIETEAITGIYNSYYWYFAYDPKTHAFNCEEPFFSIVNPSINTKRREITGFYKGRAIGDIYTRETYRFENGTYVLVKEEGQDIISGYYDDAPTYRHTVKELRGGKMVVTEDTTFTAQTP